MAILTFTLVAFSRRLYTDLIECLDYTNLIEEVDSFMPNLENLPVYETAEIYYQDNYSQFIYLVISFTDVMYNVSKELILQVYSFLNEPVLENDYYIMPEAKFEYESYIIKIIERETFDYPEQFGIIGYSDDKQ